MYIATIGLQIIIWNTFCIYILFIKLVLTDCTNLHQQKSEIWRYVFFALKRGFPKFGTAAARFRLAFQMAQVSDNSDFFLLSTAKLCPGIKSQWWRRDFPRPFRPSLGPSQPSVQCVTVFIPPGVKRPGRGFHHPPPSRTEVKERVELYLYSSGPSRPLLW